MKTIAGLFLVSAFFLTSCEEETNPAVDLTADAGVDLTTEVGDEVVLDASNSSSNENNLNYIWTFVDIPGGSNVNLSGSNTQNPTFTPDEPGEYTIMLTITVNNFADSDTVMVKANASGIMADAGSDQNVTTGTQVSLDGSNSYPSDGSLSYSWSFEDKPGSSQAQLVDAGKEVASFTPDVDGDYEVQLEVSDGSSNDREEITITASSSTSSSTSTEVSGSIDENTTWTDHLSDTTVPDYILTGDVKVNAELTIEPGVLIHAHENVRLNIKSEGGVLLAQGESGNPIVMTSSNEAGMVYWGGVDIQSTDNRNTIDHAVIKYGGGTELDFADFVDLGANIGLRDGGALNLTNTTVSHSKAYGMYVRHGALNDFKNNNFENHAESALGLNIKESASLDGATTFSGNSFAVEIYGSSLSAPDEVYLPKLASDARYYVSGNVKIASYFSVDPGAKFDFAENTELRIQKDGTFVADAAEAETIVFTSARASSGIFWKGIAVKSEDARKILSNGEVSYAGNSNWGDFADFVDLPANVALMEGGKLSVLNSTVSHGKSFGMYVRHGDFIQFAGNTFSDNASVAIGLGVNQAAKIDGATTFTDNGWDGVTVFGSTVKQEISWAALQGEAKYKLTGTINVEQGLTLDPGVHVVANEDKFIKVIESGYLSAVGTSANRITLTTSNIPGQIHWGGVWIETADARNELDYVDISYAGGKEMDLDNFQDIKANVGGDGDARVSITNTNIENSDGYSVYFQGTINDVTSTGAGNGFTDNVNNVYMP